MSRRTNIQRDAFVAFVKTLAGEELTTIGGSQKFSVEVESRGLRITPHSSGMQRMQSNENIDRFHERFEQVGSLKTTDYTDMNRNASYHLALIKRFLGL